MEKGEIPNDIISQQNERIQEYIKQRKWKLVKKYSDRKKEEFEETAYLQMKQDAMGRQFDCLVIDSMFRCGRNSNVAAELFKSMFLPAGLQIAVVEDDFCSLDVTEQEAVVYLDRKAKEYKDKLVTEDMRKFNETKKYYKYGFRYKDGKMELEIDPEPAEIVRRIFRLSSEGQSCSEIAKILTEEKIESSGNYVNKLWGRKIKDEHAAWKRDQIKRILYNRQYIGEWERTIDGKKQMFSCPMVVDMELFQKAQKSLTHRSINKKNLGLGKLNPFSGRIFDKESGIPLKLYPHQRLKITHELDMVIPDTDRWTGDRVKTILVNQAYIGTTIYGKRKRAKYRNMPEHHTDPKDWVIHENTHESIIARPDFDEVQRIWNRASEKYKESVERGLARQRDIVDSFPQKVKCMECGMTMTYMRYTNFGQSHGIRKGFYYCKEYDGKPGYCRQKVHEDLLKIIVMDQIHNMIQAMCDRKVLLEKMKEGSYDKGELVSLRVRIQNMQFKLMKAEETSATLYENFATGLLDEQEYQMLREHYTEEKEKLETGIREAQTRKRVVEKSIEEFLEIEKNLEKYLDERSFNQKMIDELVEKIYVSSKGMIEIQMKCSDVFQKITEILE